MGIGVLRAIGSIREVCLNVLYPGLRCFPEVVTIGTYRSGTRTMSFQVRWLLALGIGRTPRTEQMIVARRSGDSMRVDLSYVAPRHGMYALLKDARGAADGA